MRGKRAKTLLVILSLVVAIMSTMTRPAYAQSRSMGSNLLKVGDSTVKRIMPVPESDSTYADADYTEVHFRQNKADLDLDYMDNGKSLEGSLAFLLSGWIIAACYCSAGGLTGGTVAVWLAGVAVSCVAEFFNEQIHLDDNFTIPLLFGAVAQWLPRLFS